MDRATRNKILIAALILFSVAIIAGVVIAITGDTNNKIVDVDSSTTNSSNNVTNTDNSSSEATEEYDPFDQEWDDLVYFNGKSYKYNDEIKTLLFMGIDMYDDTYEDNEIIGNNGRADTILMFIINDTDETINVLAINRDTYAKVDVYNKDREFQYDGYMQLSMQYSFSDSHTRGCRLMSTKVSEILYGVPVDYYCSITMEGVNKAIDSMGGLTLTFTDDLTYIDESFVEGTTITITSELAEKLYRYRDTSELGSNYLRMEVQTWIMQSVFEQMMHSPSTDIEDIYNEVGDSMTTDMDLETMKSVRSYTLEEFYVVPGTYVEGEYHDEYHLDENALQELIIELFYVEQN